MRRAFPIAAALATAAACARPAATTPPETPAPALSAAPAAASAVVGPNGARFVIPVGRAAPWRWHAAGTPANAAEYRWEVELAGADSVQGYNVGFSLFNPPQPATPEEGTLAALLAAGQATVWERTPGPGARAATWGRVEVDAVGDSAVAIVVRDSTTVARLFASRPATAAVVTQTPAQAVERRVPLPIAYVDH
jgi:hypothetical protein